MTATGAAAGSNPVPAGPDVVTAADGSPPGSTPAERTIAPPFGKSIRGTPRLMLRGIISALLAVLAGAAAWLLLRHGIRTDDFPPFLADTPSTPITRYSGPWITAAAGAALVAALLLMSAVLDAVRWSRAVREVTE